MGDLVKRNSKVAFLGAPDASIFNRMKGFTDLSISKNAAEYTRQYVDEAFEQTDVTRYSPSISYGFDQYEGDAVHEDIIAITDGELLGEAAVRSIIYVDIATGKAKRRDFSVIPDSEGGSMDAYTFSGSMKVKSEITEGTAVSDDGFQTITFTPDEDGTVLVTFNISSLAGQTSNAKIVVAGKTIYTDAGGIAQVMLTAGSKSYTISKTGFTNKTGSVTVATDPVYKAETILAA